MKNEYNNYGALMEYIKNLIVPAIFTALGSAIGAGIYAMVVNCFKKKEKELKCRDARLFQKMDTIQSELQVLMRYNLQQSSVIGTILDAMKTNHINGNIERAEQQLDSAQLELNNALINHIDTRGIDNGRK